MNILKKLTIKNLKLNKKRAVGTVVGIILSVALLTAVSGMFVCFRSTLVEKTVSSTGYYHLELNAIDDNFMKIVESNKDIRSIYKVGKVGTSVFDRVQANEGDLASYVRIYSMDYDTFENLKYGLVKGKYPKNSNEIAVSESFLEESGKKIGERIVLNPGKRVSEDGIELYDNDRIIESEKIVEGIEKSYIIVGVVSKYNTRFNYGITTGEETQKTRVYLAFKKPREYKKSMLELFGLKNDLELKSPNFKPGFHYSLNNELLRWEIFKFSDRTIQTLYTIVSVVLVIIVVTSVFCIRNSFAISTTEKMKMYGMLASTGATKKQIRKSVVYEGFILGIIGIPIGVLSGILADFILVKLVSAILGDYLFAGFNGLVFRVSFLGILLSIILGSITIYLSSIMSAIKAGKVSPIDNLKNSNDVKVKSKDMKIPKYVSGIFKTGGVLAYKNLKRSKKKYRTTVISLAVSIFVFIAMSTFINRVSSEATQYYTDYDYNFTITGNLEDLNSSQLNEIKKLDNINNIYLTYEKRDTYIIKDKDMIVKVYDDINYPDENIDINNEYFGMYVIALPDETFREYVKKIGGNYDEIKDKGILCDEYRYMSSKTKREKETRKYKYGNGDIIHGTLDGVEINFEVGEVSNIRPYGYEGYYYDGGLLIVNLDYCKEIDFKLRNILINTDNGKVLQNDIKELAWDLETFDATEQVREEKAMILVVSIFLYGFITVISLIGVTNIFNTITSNMELRSKEFAMLKSIGMTKKEFNRMVNLETLFYSSKALLYGVVLGLFGSYLIHKSFGIDTDVSKWIPFKSILISVVLVFIIVSIIMKYSIRKINSLNTIDTIRNENV